MTQYHLWLTPAGEAYDRLARLINRLSQQYRGPRFEPHITLLGGIEGEERIICEQASTLAQSLRPLDLHLIEPAYQDQYFRCLYLTVKETPDILEAHHQARCIFSKIPQASFHPHVSLLYGLLPSRVKQDIINSLPPDLPETFSAVALQLIQAESANPQDWHSIQFVRLKKVD